jgi:hypothetical protein
VPELRGFLAERATPGAWTLDAQQATDRGEGELVGGWVWVWVRMGRGGEGV